MIIFRSLLLFLFLNFWVSTVWGFSSFHRVATLPLKNEGNLIDGISPLKGDKKLRVYGGVLSLSLSAKFKGDFETDNSGSGLFMGLDTVYGFACNAPVSGFTCNVLHRVYVPTFGFSRMSFLFLIFFSFFQ